MIQHRGIRACACLICFGVFLADIGCGKNQSHRAAIGGKVTLDGQPLVQGSIFFTPAEGVRGAAAGGQIADGRYRLSGKEGPAIGWNRVEIRALRKSGRMVPKPLAPTGQTIPEQVEAIPPRFNSESTLKVEIKPGDNTANFELTSK